MNYGQPIEVPHPGALHRSAPPLTVLENQILMPSFAADRKNETLAIDKGGYFVQDPKSVPPSKTEEGSTGFSDFGATFAQPHLKPLVWFFWKGKLEDGLKPLESSAAVVAAAEAPESDENDEAEAVTAPEPGSKAWPLSLSLRKSFGLANLKPGPEAATQLKERLAELGIEPTTITFDPSWSVEIAASPADLRRLDALMERYAEGQQIFITWKVIETASPLEDEGGLILSDEEFQRYIRKINQMKGADLMSAPSVVARTFNTATVEVVREFIYPESYAAPELGKANSATESEEGTPFPVSPANPVEFKTRNTGVKLTARPRLLEDGSIEMAMLTEVTEFEGFLNFGQPIYTLEKGPLGKYRRIVLTENRIEMPVFQSREAESIVRISDGSTVFLGGIVKNDVQSVEDKVPILGDLPVIGKVARTEFELQTSRYLYFFARAQLIDPAGSPVSKATKQED